MFKFIDFSKICDLSLMSYIDDNFNELQIDNNNNYFIRFNSQVKNEIQYRMNTFLKNEFNCMFTNIILFSCKANKNHRNKFNEVEYDGRFQKCDETINFDISLFEHISYNFFKNCKDERNVFFLYDENLDIIDMYFIFKKLINISIFSNIEQYCPNLICDTNSIIYEHDEKSINNILYLKIDDILIKKKIKI